MPLCVDLDGTLIKTDLLFESFAQLLKRKPWLLLLVPFWCLKGRAALKQHIAKHTSVDVSSLPYNAALLNWLHRERATKRQLLLVTAADESVANQVADHLGIFDGVIASDGKRNLKGRDKLREIRRVAPGGFEYAGNSRSDLHIWRDSSAAVVVGASPSIIRQVEDTAQQVTRFDRPRGRVKQVLAALRMHQWAKNLLVFVPLVTSHQLVHPTLLFKCAISFVLFCLCASSQYILNDLVDLEADRRHPTKCRRPFASGELPIAFGFLLAPLLLAIGLGGALVFSKLLATALAGYFVLSTAYSLRLKSVVVLDAFLLSGLYTFRIVVGHLITGISFSEYLLSFAFFVFLSLAFGKRWSELNNRRAQGGKIAGRGYHAEDAMQVNLFGVSSAFLSTVIFILYLQSDKVRQLYHAPQMLWPLAPVFLYWMSRLWIHYSRNEVNEDPILFVLKDRATYVIAAFAGVIMMAASAGWPRPF